MKITFYESNDEMWDDLRRQMQRADALVTEEQKRYLATWESGTV